MAKPKCTCTICGTQFDRKSSGPNKFCGAACYHEAQRRGEYNRGSSHKSPCAECGAMVVGRPKAKRRNGQAADKIFCNRQCYDRHRAKVILDERLSQCVECGEKYIKFHQSKGRFCSMACRVAHKRPKPKHCANCGCWFTAIKTIRRKSGIKLQVVSSAATCSESCMREWASRNPDRRKKISKAFRAEKHPNWQGGSHYGATRGPGWQRIAEQCRERHGRKCKHCGMPEEESKAKGWGRLQVNHIVPFWQWSNKTKANAQSNLEALCKSCHTKADWKWRKENAVQMALPIFK